MKIMVFQASQELLRIKMFLTIWGKQEGAQGKASTDTMFAMKTLIGLYLLS